MMIQFKVNHNEDEHEDDGDDDNEGAKANMTEPEETQLLVGAPRCRR